MSNKITFKSLASLVKQYNEECNKDKSDEKAQEKRRALLALRRLINGPEGVTPEELETIAGILAEGERDMAEKFEEANLSDIAIQRLQLADDVDDVIVEILTIEGGGDGEE